MNSLLTLDECLGYDLDLQHLLTTLARALPVLFRIFNIGSARYEAISSTRLRKSVITTLERITYRAYRFRTIRVLFRASVVRNIEIWRSVDAHNRLTASKSI